MDEEELGEHCFILIIVCVDIYLVNEKVGLLIFFYI